MAKNWAAKQTSFIGDEVIRSIRSARDKAMLTVASILQKTPWGKFSKIVNNVKQEVRTSARMTDALDKLTAKKQTDRLKKVAGAVVGKKVVRSDRFGAKKSLGLKKGFAQKGGKRVAVIRGKGNTVWETRKKKYGPSGRKKGGAKK